MTRKATGADSMADFFPRTSFAIFTGIALFAWTTFHLEANTTFVTNIGCRHGVFPLKKIPWFVFSFVCFIKVLY